jgi:hypothetical protein
MQKMVHFAPGKYNFSKAFLEQCQKTYKLYQHQTFSPTPPSSPCDPKSQLKILLERHNKNYLNTESEIQQFFLEVCPSLPAQCHLEIGH